MPSDNKVGTVASALEARDVCVDDLRDFTLNHLREIIEKLRIPMGGDLPFTTCIFRIVMNLLSSGKTVSSSGVIEVFPEGFGFIRSKKYSYHPSADDVYVYLKDVRRFAIKTGDSVCVTLSPPDGAERYFSAREFVSVNGIAAKDCKKRTGFDNLTAVYPDRRIKLEMGDGKDQALRAIELLAPIGFGQRALIVAPPRTGKTMILQSIAKAVEKNHPEAALMVLLIDERPEEVSDMRRMVKGEVISSTFDEPPARHVRVVDFAIERAKRLVECGKDVVVVLDSITRLARAHNAIMPSSGRVLTGGVDSQAMQRPKRVFGTARNFQEGGSLTIIGTALIETGSRMDEVIYEEFKGTGNCEIVLSRKLAESRIWPAISCAQSGTRREELITSPDSMTLLWALRRILSGMGASDSTEFLLDKLHRSTSNADLLKSAVQQPRLR